MRGKTSRMHAFARARAATRISKSGVAGFLAALFLLASAAAAQPAAVTVSPGAGTYAAPVTVTLSCATAGAVIRYTTNGANPTAMSPSVASGGTVAVGASLTLKAVAYLSTTPGAMTTAAYVINGEVSAGGAHSLALFPNGTVWSWGSNYYG